MSIESSSTTRIGSCPIPIGDILGPPIGSLAPVLQGLLVKIVDRLYLAMILINLLNIHMLVQQILAGVMMIRDHLRGFILEL